ncbi:helix-turn-helix domain-containing protein [Aquibium microcysteis]|uniref:helix-turn-helix domain-containing protein n=1 Tax=Aquibium microcysteis TaxID=675281 RepID=UPI00165D0A53|nr:helix-turn-helix domain-containing protein [Aquibium microcysteis]
MRQPVPSRPSPAPSAAAGRVWDTRDVAAREAFGYYREGICEAFMDLVPELDAPVRERFAARVEHQQLGEGAVNRVRATAHEVVRTRAEIAHSPEECFYLNYQTEGLCEIEQAGERVSLPAGSVAIFASGVPFTLEHRRRPTLGVASFFVPTRLLDARVAAGAPRRPVVLSADPAVGHLIVETARTLGGAAALAPATSARLFSILVDLAALAVGGPAAASVDRVSARGEAAFLRLKNHVAQHMCDPRLDVASAARATGISPRYLHRLFERAGTSFGAHLLEQRLLLAASLLRDPGRAGLTVASVAFACGFRDLSHFGRAFKTRFAATPGEWRRGEAGLS